VTAYSKITGSTVSLNFARASLLSLGRALLNSVVSRMPSLHFAKYLSYSCLSVHATIGKAVTRSSVFLLQFRQSHNQFTTMFLLLHCRHLYIRLDLTSNFTQLLSKFEDSTLKMLNIVPSSFDLVGFGVITDVTGSRGVFHSIERFGDIVLDRRDTSYHGSEGVSSDGIL
jgi:hypothetical protein